MENNQIIYYKQLDSTNTKLQELATQGAPHGTVVVAREQTCGKGRRGRSWETPAGDNLYMSILLKPSFDTAKASMLTLVMAYSVAKVICKRGFFELQIKWPNDLILSGKKVCGILTELELDGTDIGHVIIGVGVNVNTASFSTELAAKATSLFLESGHHYDVDSIVKEIVQIFAEEYERFAEVGNLSYMQDEYNNMLVNNGKKVRVMEPGNEYMATAMGICSTGELIVRTIDGEEKKIFAGEVSVRGVYGYI